MHEGRMGEVENGEGDVAAKLWFPQSAAAILEVMQEIRRRCRGENEPDKDQERFASLLGNDGSGGSSESVSQHCNGEVVLSI